MALSRRHGGGHGGMSGMDGMGGMDMGSTGLFQSVNIDVAHALWYIVAAIAVVRGVRSLIDYLRTLQAKRRNTSRSAIPSKPTNVLTQAYDTLHTIFREISYPALRPFRGRFLRYYTPPPLGQCLVILAFWIIVIIMLFTDVFLTPASSLYGYRWEKPAFRAGWVSVAQVPLLYALSCKFNVISIITGISYERLNWLHRWVSRTLFLTVIVHWAYFFHEWTLANFVSYQMEMMPMVTYGFAAWAVIGWTVLTGWGFFRDLSYELWLLQHLASAGVLLWLLYVHVPSYARYNIWMAVAFVAFDRIVRGAWVLVNNLHLRAFGKGGLGYRGEATALGDGYLRLNIKNVDFNWRAGQHVFLSIPACGIFESHPFTISNTRLGPTSGTPNGEETGSRDLEVFLKCHSGFTGRLQKRALAAQARDGPPPSHRVFLSGPWGTPPLSVIERCNSVIFVTSSTGAAFNMPLLEHAVKKSPFVQRVCFYWVVRHVSQISWFDARLRAAMRQLAALGLEDITFRIFVTGSVNEAELKSVNLPIDSVAEVCQCWLKSHGLPFELAVNDAQSLASTDSTDIDEKDAATKSLLGPSKAVSSSSGSGSESESFTNCCGCKSCKCKPALSSPSFVCSLGRPCSFDPLIRPTVEAARGETVVIACGGKDMMAQIRTYVAGLSDERAVHKGTGAQGIHLWTETYGW
ncbi:ferric-chelate reductase Frp1 [Lithohypha guttulata]|uniref:ferric-chelate reductase Frp1 n=1 Tax=Lithohypha guttulata TaxID=1690604 RepID=UPI002DE093F5|nr:ferric-chelate reductase Frp1 [Lithohypha guttulata]